jgi:uncharacterized YccA/Bax inhibitor family protein
MALMRTANPALNDKTFENVGGAQSLAGRMTLDGTVNKTGLLLLCVVLTAGWTWNVFARSENPAAVMPYLLIGAIGGFIVALVTIFKQAWSPVLAPVYALLEGLVLGGISAFYEKAFKGIVIQAVLLTLGVTCALLFAYRARIIRATENFKLGVFAATGGIALIYLAGFVMSFFGAGIPYIHESGAIGIGFSLLVVVIASLNLVLDFDFIEHGVEQGAPKYMEWYAAFGLMVTLIWLYLEMLRLLAKLRSRR